MAYDQYSLDQAKKKGIFNDKVFDPKVLQLSEEEKAKLKKNVSKYQTENQDLKTDESSNQKIAKIAEKKEIQVELNLFEMIYMFFLSIFGAQTVDNYKLHKALRIIEKNLTRHKPAVYNPLNQRITKYFAYKMHDAYLKILTLIKIMDKTINNRDIWDNSEQKNKTGLEIFFEKIMNINSKEVDHKFSYLGINRILSDFESVKLAEDAVLRSVREYLSSIEKSSIETANKIYTNLIYIKNLTDFDFIQFFKRFDTQFNPGVSPAFSDISGEALLPYLSQLEENILQIDFAMDNVLLFKTLSDIGYFLSLLSEPSHDNEKPEDEEEKNHAINEKLENELIVCFDSLKELLSKNYFTLLLQVIRKDPNYSPSFIHTKYDIFKAYSDTFEQRTDFISKYIIKEKKIKRIEISVKRIFNSIKWVGIYNIELSMKIEELDVIGFIYCYHIGIINTFLMSFYDEMIKTILNITVTNGLFIEKYFQKTVSDTFYAMEKFEEKIRDFNFDMNSDGLNGKKIINLMAKKDINPAEFKKNLERNAAYVNTRAKELFEEFFPNFILINDIVTKLYNDIDAKPPKYIRNIRTIGGLKNPKYLNAVMKSHEALNSIKDLITMLKE